MERISASSNIIDVSRITKQHLLTFLLVLEVARLSKSMMAWEISVFINKWHTAFKIGNLVFSNKSCRRNYFSGISDTVRHAGTMTTGNESFRNRYLQIDTE